MLDRTMSHPAGQGFSTPELSVYQNDKQMAWIFRSMHIRFSSQFNKFLDWLFAQQVRHVQGSSDISKTRKTTRETVKRITVFMLSTPPLLNSPKSCARTGRLKTTCTIPGTCLFNEDSTQFKKCSTASRMAIINDLLLLFIVRSNSSLVSSPVTSSPLSDHALASLRFECPSSRECLLTFAFRYAKVLLSIW